MSRGSRAISALRRRRAQAAHWSAASARSSVTPKKNRNAVTVLLIVGGRTWVAFKCNWKRRKSSAVAVSGDRPRKLAKVLTARM